MGRWEKRTRPGGYPHIDGAGLRQQAGHLLRRYPMLGAVVESSGKPGNVRPVSPEKATGNGQHPPRKDTWLLKEGHREQVRLELVVTLSVDFLAVVLLDASIELDTRLYPGQGGNERPHLLYRVEGVVHQERYSRYVIGEPRALHLHTEHHRDQEMAGLVTGSANILEVLVHL